MNDVESDAGFMATHSKPGHNYAKFYWHPVRMNKKSEEAGRDIYEDRIYILIYAPGSKSDCRRPMQEKDKREYPQAWADFQNGEKEPTVVGTPIEYLGISPARAKELRAVNIHTIEQMANCADTAKVNVGMDFVSLKNRAQAFVNKNSPEVMELRATAERQARQIAELTEKLEQLSAAKKPGRPRRTAEVQAAA